jgi:hypothetical protein
VEALDASLSDLEEAAWDLGLLALLRPGMVRPSRSYNGRRSMGAAVAHLASSGGAAERADRLAAVVKPLADLEARLRDPGRKCEECGSPMGARKRGAIYCSAKCRQRACRKRNRIGGDWDG